MLKIYFTDALTMQILEMIKPDDWHVHFRDTPYLKDTVNATAATFARALVMPNLTPPLTDVPSLLAYRERILQALAPSLYFTPYMTLYLQETLSPQTFEEAKRNPFILGAKLYPAHATTNAQHGVKDILRLYPLLEVMQAKGLILQIHGEQVGEDIFERETRFITESLIPLIKSFPKLKIVLEHISTKAAVDFVMQASSLVGATITAHHLYFNRNDLLSGGIRPHLYCLPILKTATDQKALQMAAISGNPRFFAGTDSAPHAINQKLSACGCAGVYSAPYAVAFYAQCFDTLHQLDKLEPFLSHFGAQFYNLPLNTQRIVLTSKPQMIPKALRFGQDEVVPMAFGQTIPWSVYDA